MVLLLAGAATLQLHAAVQLTERQTGSLAQVERQRVTGVVSVSVGGKLS